jgi:predicted nucleic acid-binding protein
VTPVVIDASAGVELAADTSRGRELRSLLPADALPWVPDLFFGECGAVLRRWERRSILVGDRLAETVEQIAKWHLRVAESKPLFRDAWRRRANVTFADAIYVALAEHLEAPLLTVDGRLQRAPGISVRFLSLGS